MFYVEEHLVGSFKQNNYKGKKKSKSKRNPIETCG
jgi:hypothetical protein